MNQDESNIYIMYLPERTIKLGLEHGLMVMCDDGVPMLNLTGITVLHNYCNRHLVEQSPERQLDAADYAMLEDGKTE